MTIKQRIAFFEFVRDIPYHIGLDDMDPTYNCVTKAEMLGQMLAGLGLKTRQIICTFDWTETPLPKTILAMPRDPGETHQFLQMFNPRTKNWVNVDPSWDNKLRAAGFPIANWDGQNDTVLAVKPHVIYSPVESAKIIADESDAEASDIHMDKHRPFYQAINEWLKSVR